MNKEISKVILKNSRLWVTRCTRKKTQTAEKCLEIKEKLQVNCKGSQFVKLELITSFWNYDVKKTLLTLAALLRFITFVVPIMHLFLVLFIPTFFSKLSQIQKRSSNLCYLKIDISINVSILYNSKNVTKLQLIVDQNI